MIKHAGRGSAGARIETSLQGFSAAFASIALTILLLIQSFYINFFIRPDSRIRLPETGDPQIRLPKPNDLCVGIIAGWAAGETIEPDRWFIGKNFVKKKDFFRHLLSAKPASGQRIVLRVDRGLKIGEVKKVVQALGAAGYDSVFLQVYPRESEFLPCLASREWIKRHEAE